MKYIYTCYMLYEYIPDIIDKCRIEVELKDNWNF